MIRTSKAELISAFRSLQLPVGHIYVVHSSLLRLGLIEDGLKGVMECLWDVLGRDATILMPSFTFDFARTRSWDYHLTRSETGALTERFRKLTGVLRTIHPFHSMAAVGPYAQQFSECAALSSFGPGSPFSLLYEMKAINIAIGIDLVGGATFLHHAEELAQVPYRFYKEFPGNVMNQNGEKLLNTYKMYVREITETYKYDNNWGRVRNDLKDEGLLIEARVKGAPLLAFYIKPTHDYFLARMNEDPYYCAEKIIIKHTGEK